MKTSILLSPALVLAVFFGAFSPPDGRSEERDGYSVEVKVTPKEGEARVTEVTGIALEQDSSVEFPLSLSHSEKPATVSLDFELGLGTVSINIEDLDFAPRGDGKIVQQRDYFEAELFFELGKEKTICTTAAETISFTVTAPSAEQAEQGELAGTIDISQLEVEFYQDRNSSINGFIYNPTQQSISNVIVRVTAAAVGEFEGLDRRHRSAASIRPMSDGTLQIKARLPDLPEGGVYKFSLESAR